MTALEIAARAGKLETVKKMLVIQKMKWDLSTEYVEDLVGRMIKSDKPSLDMIEELVQHITIKGNHKPGKMIIS